MSRDALPSYWPASARAAALLVLLALLMGCVQTGDFGRLRPESKLLKPNAPEYTGSIAVTGDPLTDDERELRAQAKGLFAGPYGRKVAAAVASGADPERVAALIGPRQDNYATELVNGHFRSTTARYARLVDDTRDDVVRLDQFLAVARRVADIDRKRERSIAHASRVSPEEVHNARRRVRENMMLMAEVKHALEVRTAVYRTALERLVIAVPSPIAIEAERARGELERRLAAMQIVG